MEHYRRRNRTDEPEAVKTADLGERELVLRLKKDELLDRTVLLPHAEVNPAVYGAVERFVEKYSGKEMLLTIMTNDVSKPIQDIFIESYRSHYEDEYQKILRFLKRRYVRAACLLLISALAFWLSTALARNLSFPDYLLTILGQISVFCLWEIGYTHFTRSDAAAERDRILRARDAEIQFQCRGDAER